MLLPPPPLRSAAAGWPALLAVSLVALAGRLLATPASAGSPTPEPSWGDKVIELPKFDVVDRRVLPKPEKWHYAEIPGFEILSNISARETRRFTSDFLLLQEVIQVIMPALNRGRSDVPTALILCGGSQGYDEFVPADRSDDEYRANSLFFENPERTAIVIDFAQTELQLENTERIEADPYRSFYREYFRFLIRRQIGHNAPAWLEEGLVQLFAGIDFNNRWISFGLIGDGFGGPKAGDFNQLLARRWLMPFDEMFDHPSRATDALWSAQCYAFVHMCLYSQGKRLQKPFLEFVSRLNAEPANEALFRECFHESYKDMAIELRGYLQFTAYTYVTFKGKKGQKLPEPPPVTVRAASPAEVGRLKGEVLRLGGHDDAAHLQLIAPYIRGDHDPRLLAALGLDEELAGHDERAARFLEAAAQARVVRARAYLELGRLRFHAALAAAKDNAPLAAPEVQHVLAPLLTARTQPPPLHDVYALIADVWSHSAAPPAAEQFAVLIEGVRQFPRDPNLLETSLSLASRGHLEPQARWLAAVGTQVFAHDPAELRRIMALAPSTAPAADRDAPVIRPDRP